MHRSVILLAAALVLVAATVRVAAAEALPRCLFVSSYHQGYAWSDGVQRGIERILAGRCQLKQFDLDSKRHKGEAAIRAAADRARQLVESWQPDVLIAADDNASRYLVKPYYRDAALPVVFCGVNWSVDEYQYPYSNVTGMVEVAPLKPMLREALALGNGDAGFFYVGASTATEEKNRARFERAAAAMGLTMESRLVNSMRDWIEAYRAAQAYPFLVIGSYAGIADWDENRVRQAIGPISRRLSVTNHGWMMPVTMLGFTKVPEEHGEWAAEAALAILGGVPPARIPIVANRKWDLWINQALVDEAGLRLPRKLTSRAKQVH